MRRGLGGVQTPTFAFGRKAQQWNCTSDNEEEIVRRTRNRSPIGVEVPMWKEEAKNVLHWNTGIAPAFKENEIVNIQLCLFCGGRGYLLWPLGVIKCSSTISNKGIFFLVLSHVIPYFRILFFGSSTSNYSRTKRRNKIPRLINQSLKYEKNSLNIDSLLNVNGWFI